MVNPESRDSGPRTTMTGGAMVREANDVAVTHKRGFVHLEYEGERFALEPVHARALAIAIEHHAAEAALERTDDQRIP